MQENLETIMVALTSLAGFIFGEKPGCEIHISLYAVMHPILALSPQA